MHVSGAVKSVRQEGRRRREVRGFRSAPLLDSGCWTQSIRIRSVIAPAVDSADAAMRPRVRRRSCRPRGSDCSRSSPLRCMDNERSPFLVSRQPAHGCCSDPPSPLRRIAIVSRRIIRVASAMSANVCMPPTEPRSGSGPMDAIMQRNATRRRTARMHESHARAGLAVTRRLAIAMPQALTFAFDRCARNRSTSQRRGIDSARAIHAPRCA